MALSINGWSITGGTGDGSGTKVIADIDQAEKDEKTGASSATLEQDFLRTALDADANHATQTAVDAKNAAISLNKGTYKPEEVENALAKDAAAFPAGVGGGAGGPNSLKDGWGINGTGTASNVGSELTKLLNDANSGNVGGLEQEAMQESLNADAAGDKKLATDTQNMARGLANGKFDLAESIKSLTADQSQLTNK
jgi:hypothetical protein